MVNAKQKTFFKDRTPKEIRSLRTKEVGNKRNLVQKILDLNITEEAIILQTPIIPGRFIRGTKNWNQASNKCWKHGNYLRLSQPKTIEEAMQRKESPLKIRKRDFDDRLFGLNQAEIDTIGYSFRPIKGTDRTKRLVPFARILDGARLFTYALQKTKKGIDIKPYDDALRVETEGAIVMASVPSKRQRIRRYEICVGRIPIHDNEHQYAITWGWNTQGGKVPEHKIWKFRYKGFKDPEQSNIIIADDKDIAISLGIARHYAIEEENLIPWENNIFAKPSQLTATYDTKLRNNLLIYDPTLKRNPKLRHLHLPERSIMLSKLIGHLGHNETMFWKAKRDPKLHEYNWNAE